MLKRWILTGTMLACLTMAGWAQDGPEGGPEPGPPEISMMDVDRLAAPLGLSQEQREQLNQIAIRHVRKMIELKGRLQLQKFDLEVLMRQDKPDPEQARKLAAQAESTHAALEMERLEMRLATKAVLTPTQQQKLRELSPPRERPMRRPGPPDGPGRRGPGPQEGPRPPGPGAWDLAE
ncbi:MAG: hypothetical protein AMXMBFR33_60540 [Candidatus Xenobia bacterium]